MKRFHKPGDEKRSVVIVPPDGYADWLSCTTTGDVHACLPRDPAEARRAAAYPLPPRKPAAHAPAEDQAPLP